MYQGVNTFSEVLSRDKRKDEHIQILQHQEELKDKFFGYRAMELDILEKVRKYREEKESQEAKVPPVITYPYGNMGKRPMEDPPHVIITQQLKTMMQTSQESKEKLVQMTSLLDSQVAASSKPTTETQVTTTVT